MVYQALLFSTDEKTSRVVSQILSELEFHVEVCAEPFVAVKQITNQHYDAIVVDCDNEQNATLLFKSARNSSSNAGSLAVALVQGQGGIAKAFRIGANLVLTKPIHVEQSKGTLRTAKGLLRKAEAARANSAAVPAPKFDDASVPFQPAPALLAADTGFSTGAAVSAALELQAEQFPELGPAEAALLESMPPPVPMQSSSAASEPQAIARQTPAETSAQPMGIQTLAGSAAAAAPAKTEVPQAAKSLRDEPVVKEPRTVAAADKKNASKSPSSRREAFAQSSAFENDERKSAHEADRDANEHEGAGNKRNFVIAAVLVLAAAGALYYGWPQLQPLLTGIPIVQKYFAPEQAPRPALAPTPATAQPASNTTSTGSDALPGTAAVPGQTANSQTDASTSSSAPVGSSNQPAAAVKSANSSADSSSDSASVARHPSHLAPEAAAGLLLQKVDAIYPPSALQQRAEGSVQLQATIGKDGSTSNVKILSGKPLFTTAAASAVRQWKYKPYRVNGQPTEVQTEVTVDFKLPQP